jgi:hypothetical protein
MNSGMNNLTPMQLVEFDALYEGRIDSHDRNILEDKLSSDADLAYNYLVYQMLRKKLDSNVGEKDLLKNRFQLAEKQQMKRKRTFLYLAFATAAAILLLLVSRTFLPAGDNRLYLSYRDSEVGLPIMMNQSPKDILKMSMIDMANSNYESALAYLSILPESDTSAFYIGFCNEMLNRDAVAISIYSRLEKSTSAFIAHKSSFRLGLMYIKANHSKRESQIRKVAENPLNPYQPQAGEILKSLIRD